jgi:hypothetical protein
VQDIEAWLASLGSPTPVLKEAKALLEQLQ